MAEQFTRLQISGYRRLADIDLELRPLNVLIGANGVGKSSILDVFNLLAASALGQLQQAVSEMGGFRSLLTADGKARQIGFAVTKKAENGDETTYRLQLAQEGLGFTSPMEALDKQTVKGKKFVYFQRENGHTAILDNQPETAIGLAFKDWPQTAASPTESVLSILDKSHEAVETFRKQILSVSEIYHSLDVSKRAPIRNSQTLRHAKEPGNDGEDLFPCLYTLKETAPHRFEAIEDTLRVIFPTFDKLTFPPVAAGQLTMGWKDKTFRREFYPNELSEGTLRFLWLVTLLQCPELPAVTLIDEPEVSLHPEMLQLLTDLMREASARTQLIVATHSDRFVRFLKPDELVICDLNDQGHTTLKRGTDLDLAHWLNEYGLDELWAQGVLGGRI